jgi:uncharacterized protein YjbJ (UPF0337 family)
MNKDQSHGYCKEAEGKVKEVVGKWVGNTQLALKRTIQEAKGGFQAALAIIFQLAKDAFGRMTLVVQPPVAISGLVPMGLGRYQALDGSILEPRHKSV